MISYTIPIELKECVCVYVCVCVRACTCRSHLGSASDLRYSMVEGQDGHYSTTVIRRAHKGRLAALRDDPNKVPHSLPPPHTHILHPIVELPSPC